VTRKVESQGAALRSRPPGSSQAAVRRRFPMVFPVLKVAGAGENATHNEHGEPHWSGHWTANRHGAVYDPKTHEMHLMHHSDADYDVVLTPHQTSMIFFSLVIFIVIAQTTLHWWKKTRSGTPNLPDATPDHLLTQAKIIYCGYPGGCVGVPHRNVSLCPLVEVPKIHPTSFSARPLEFKPPSYRRFVLCWTAWTGYTVKMMQLARATPLERNAPR